MFKEKNTFNYWSTGSFGNAVLNRFLNTAILKRNSHFSRDEKSKRICELN